MAERSVLMLSTKPFKTQEFMRAKLDEWRKAKQKQTAEQLKQRKQKLSHQGTTCIKQSRKTSLLTEPPFTHQKMKSFATRHKTRVNITNEIKTEDRTFNHDRNTKGKNTNLSRTPAGLRPNMDKFLSTRERLELWRKEKGKTPKTSGITKTPATLRRKSTMTSRKKNHQPITLESLQLEPFETMNCDLAERECTPEETKKKLQECLEKLQEDKVSDEIIASQLDAIQSSHPGALQCAEFWICRAKIAEHEEDDGRVVCLYEQALVYNAEPEQLIMEAVVAYSKKRKGPGEAPTLTDEELPNEEPTPTHQSDLVTPSKDDDMTKHAGHLSPFDSSIIKYSVTKATPFRSRLMSCERPVATPVRRSTRLERRSMHYPTMLQEHGLAVRHLDDLPEDIKKDVMFKPNFTVENYLNEAWKDLWE